ncbi:MAG: Thioesterase super member 4 [Sclerophora amabilis]|nr:MAG: Thioesterase super member 4 [Sclerophora amabilis]
MTKTLDADPAWVYLTSGTDPPVFARGFMAGARAIAYQVVFRNHADQVEVSILYIGQGLSGFPNTTHGGAIATVMDEVCRRTAINSARSIKPAEFKCELEALDMTYKAPANTGQFYTLVSNVDGDASTDGLYTIRATLKTRRGKPCAEATARYRMTELENGRSIAKGDVKTLEKGGEGDEGNNMIDASRCQKETVYKS